MELNFTTDHEVYTDQAGTNWWEYHFEPVRVGEAHEPLALPHYALTTLGLPNLFEMPTQRAHELLTKYIKPKPIVTEHINGFARQQFGNKYVIGVYYIKSIGELLQPTVPYDSVFHALEEHLRHAPTDYKIFLATNDARFFDEIQRRYPSLIFFDRPTQEKLPRFREERQAIATCILLSKVNMVIGTASELLKVVRQFNPDVTVIEVDTLWLEKK